jgi:hypothetical protein
MDEDKLVDWLKICGAEGLSWLKLAVFPFTGRGVETLRRLNYGDKVLIIPGSSLWTTEVALNDLIIGPILRSINQQLTDEDILALYLLFIRSRNEGYEGRREHINLLPKSYKTSICFSEDELEVCYGSSLYHITYKLKQQIKEDYIKLYNVLLSKHPEYFPLEMCSQNDVSVTRIVYKMWLKFNPLFSSISGLFALSGVVVWISNYMINIYDVLPLSRTC